jgi:hypothetical protein
MFHENPFSGTCEYALYEVLVMLLGSALLGLLLGYLIWGWLKNHVATLEKEAQRHKRIAARRQLQVASMITRVKSVEYALQYATTKTSLAEFRLKKANEEIEILREQPAPKEPVINTSDWGQDEPTLATLSEIMLKGAIPLADKEDEVRDKATQPLLQSRDDDALPDESDDTISENDDTGVFETISNAGELTEILGINEAIALLLEKAGIHSWDTLASVDTETLRRILDTAGTLYTDTDPSSWPVQARMASRSEWKKLRVYQESLKQK